MHTREMQFCALRRDAAARPRAFLMRARNRHPARSSSLPVSRRALKFRSDALLATVPGLLSLSRPLARSVPRALSLSLSLSLALALFLARARARAFVVPHVRSHTYNIFEQLGEFSESQLLPGVVGGPRGGIIRGERVRASSRASG